MRNISGQTRVVGIIGDPVCHSRSPAMHNAAFAAFGVDYVYLPFHVRAPDLRAAVAAVRALDLVGFNVTVPHKERILPFLDGLTRRAKVIGAVNTVYRRGQKVLGDNTDGVGFVTALREAGHPVRGKRVILIGAGGAARAAVAGLIDSGVREILVVNRGLRRRRALVSHFRGARARITGAPLVALTDAEYLHNTDLVVNATSVGLHGERFPPLNYGATPTQCLFNDLIYGTVTDFLKGARRAQRRTLDGLGMLLHQGAEAFRIWTGRRAPFDVMARALRSQHRIAQMSKSGGKRRTLSLARIVV